MSLQGISAYGGFSFNNLKKTSSEAEDTQENQKSALTTLARNSLSSASGLSTNESSTSYQSAMSRMQTIINRIPKDENGKLTFSDAKKYKAAMEADFRDKVSTGLRKLGVDENAEFTLKMDASTGDMKVYSSHPDKEKIEAFFKANPSLVQQFEEINTLEGVTRFTERKISVPELRREIQLQSASFWMQDSEDMFSSMSSVFYKYQNSGFSSMSGLSTFV